MHASEQQQRRLTRKVDDVKTDKIFALRHPASPRPDTRHAAFPSILHQGCHELRALWEKNLKKSYHRGLVELINLIFI